jgi:site-specific recombinase XerC
LQAGEVDRFFVVIVSPRDRAVFQLMYRAGLRVSEIGRLDLPDYDRETARVMIHRLKNSNSG